MKKILTTVFALSLLLAVSSCDKNYVAPQKKSATVVAPEQTKLSAENTVESSGPEPTLPYK